MRNRLWYLPALLLLLTACLPGSRADGPGPRPPADRPNFIVVLADDLDESLMPYMPRVRRLLAEQGTTLSRFYANLPWCCPSRATLLRGQYAHNTGVWSNNPPNGGFREFHGSGQEKSTLATWLRSAGYRTGLFGKYLNGYPEQAPGVPETYVPPGWDTWVSPVAGNPFRGFDYTLNVNGRIVHRKPSPRTYFTDVLAEEARGFVAAADKRPFFAYVTPTAPHPPAIPAPRHRSLYPGAKAPRGPAYDPPDMTGRPAELRRLPRVTRGEKEEWDELFRQRARSVAAIDEMVESLVEALRAKGRLKNTYLVVTSDNGFHMGQYRMAPGKNTGYEGDTRVPFVVRGPGVPAGRRVNALAGNVDIAPTIAELAGARAPSFVDGRSLRSLLKGGGTSGRDAFLLEHGTARATRPAGPGDSAPPYTPATREKAYLPAFAGLRTDRYLYLEYVTRERELYDLWTDPHQLRNLAGTDPVEPRLASWLGRLRACAAERCRRAESGAP
ncbi:sulfatase family protein [Actinomadura kijaniata]|uniref:sulfatase family protein n=1 Tax=Actinomadura kijaniata TaxID=46161 RepID=UPI000833D164|nr:sulfatase [Actinomadura kijaniata]